VRLNVHAGDEEIARFSGHRILLVGKKRAPLGRPLI
jgi:hypothetical protein